MIRKFLFGTLLTALLSGGCATADKVVETPKAEMCIEYTEAYKQKELERIREMVKSGEKINVLFLLEDNEDWKKVKEDSEAIIPAYLDSPLGDYKTLIKEPAYLNLALSKSNFKFKVLSSGEDLDNSILEEDEGSIDVLYFIGHGLYDRISLGKESLSVKDAKKKRGLKMKFSKRGVVILHSCLTLKDYKQKHTIAEEVSILFGVPVIASKNVVWGSTESFLKNGKETYVPTKQAGDWDMVFPYSCQD